MFNRSQPTTVWINHDTWACRRHIPSAHVPAAVERCLLSCPFVRPDIAHRPGAKGVAPPPPQPARRLEVVPPPPPEVTLEVVRQEPAPVAKPVVEDWRRFDLLDLKDLPGQSIDQLRKYAAGVLGIVGASKVRGGKPALIECIKMARDARP